MFIDNLNKIIKEKGITKAKLAREAGIPDSTLRSWENGKDPSLNKVIKISRYFGISIDELVDNDIYRIELSENEKELLNLFKQMSEREQIKLIGVVEDRVKHEKSLYSGDQENIDKLA